MAILVPVGARSTIQEAVAAAGATLEPGSIFCYKMEKKEDVSAAKTVALLRDGETNPVLGDDARSKLGLPIGGAGSVAPKDVPAGFTCFVQSTSHNRLVPSGSAVLILKPGAKSSTQRTASKSPRRLGGVPLAKTKTEEPAVLPCEAVPSASPTAPAQVSTPSPIDCKRKASNATPVEEAGTKKIKLLMPKVEPPAAGGWCKVGEVYVKDYGAPAVSRVAAFDMDSTLIETKSGKTFAISKDDWKLWDSAVPAKLQDLGGQGFKIVIITNQGGVNKGQTKLADIQAKIDAIQISIKVQCLAMILIGDDLFRKPLPGSWELLESHFNSKVVVDRAQSFYCGDAAGRVPPVVKKKDFSDNDLKFALNVGVPFHTPEEFFLGRTQTYERTKFAFDPRKLGESSTPFPVPDLVEQTVVVVIGPPGSGKSQVATKRFTSFARVNQDLLKTADKCHKACKEALDAGKSVVIDNQNKDPKTRAPYIAMAKAAKAQAIAIYYDVPKELCFHLNNYRFLNTSTHLHRPEKVPAMIIHAFFKSKVEPTLKEGFDKVYRVSLEHFRMETDADEVLLRSFL